MAEDVVPIPGAHPQPEPIEAEPAKPVEGRTETRLEHARRTAYRFRFLLFYFALAVVMGSAVGAFIVVLSRPEATKKVAWSTWRPDGASESARILQIVDHVPKSYKAGNGQPLVLAHASAPSVTSESNGEQITIPISQITVLPALDTISASSSLQISYCGLGQTCQVALTPSTASLLKRETLELALFTFKYTDTVDSITFLMPPTAPQSAIFLQRHDVVKQLSQPFSSYLAEKPPKPGKIPQAELRVINKITQPRLYHFNVKPESSGSAIEVLTPFGSSAG